MALAHELALADESSSSPVAIALHTLKQFGFNPNSSVEFSNVQGDCFSFIKHSPALIAKTIADCAIEYSVTAKVSSMELLQGVSDNDAVLMMAFGSTLSMHCCRHPPSLASHKRSP